MAGFLRYIVYMSHYIYIYLDPRKPGNFDYSGLEFQYEPFYVGVSKNETRQYDHLTGAKKYLEGISYAKYRNNRKIYKIAKIINDGYDPIILEFKNNLEEVEAYNLEADLVFKIGRLRLNEGPLLNYLPGGQIIDGDLISIQLRKNADLNQDKAKKVKQFDLNGVLLKIWNSVEEAKINTKVSHLDSCCRGERKTAGGFIWEYEDKKDISKRPKYKKRKTNNVRNKRSIEQYDLSNQMIAEFTSLKEAVEITKVKRTNIGNNLAGVTKTAGGYIWKYKN